MRLSVVATCLSVCLIGISAADDAHASIRKDTNIPAEGLGVALQALAKDRDFQIVYVSEEIENVRTRGAVGEFTPDEALKRLLSGTGLTYRYLDDKTVTIVAVTATTSQHASDRASSGSWGDSDSANEGRKSSSGGFRVAQVDQGANPQPSTVESNTSGSQDNSKKFQIEEIIVTAQKRAERLQDVPLSITAITADDISRRALVNSEDYLRGIPGVNQVDETSMGQVITIRGLETSPGRTNFFSGTTTATYFGETPTTNSAGELNNGGIDIKLVDINRVEVLRGPQGTAFGNSSLGGAVRTIPEAPKLDRFEGKLGAGYSSTSGNGGNNNSVQGVVNVPLVTDKLALRAVVYRYGDSGFYRNTAGSTINTAFRAAVNAYGAQAFAVDQDNVGVSRVTGARVAALWKASEDLKFTLSYLTQKSEIDGYAVANSGTYEQAVLQIAPEHERRGQRKPVIDNNINIVNGVADYDLAWADLLATYSHVASGSLRTLSWSIWSGSDLGEPTSTLEESNHREHSGEVRLATKLHGAWNGLIGLYAESLKDQGSQDGVWYGDPAKNIYLAGAHDLGGFLEQRSLTQTASFAELSWQFLPQFTLTGGVRGYHYSREITSDQRGFFYTGTVDGTKSVSNSTQASGTNFRGNLSYKPNADALIYASWAQGFRLGRPQIGLPTVCDRNHDGFVDGMPGVTMASTRTVNSDTVNSFELGDKTSLLNGRVQLNTAIFRIDWSGLPVLVVPPAGTGCAFGFTANAGDARSEGIELQSNVHLADSFRVDLGASWIRAQLVKDAPGIGAKAGARLPGSPKFNTNLGLQYDFPIYSYQASLRADAMYVGSFYGDILSSATTKSGGYAKLDLSGRVMIQNLTIDLFIHNVTNGDAFTFRDAFAYQGDQYFGFRMRPRTIGVQLGYKF
jgi:iron complex outermembrane receptor protein